MSIRNDNWIDTKSPGILGWNSFDDPSSIADQELADVKNAVYDKGFISPREGVTLEMSKPSGESGDPLQMVIATTSDGIDYMLAIYDNHFYVWHDENEEWVRANVTYVPTETTLRYGYVNWNNGRGDDRLYLCNGVDSFARWDMCVDTVNGAHLLGATTLLLSDASRFPSSGTVVIKGSSGEFVEAYTSKTNNTLNLTNTLNIAVADGVSVIMDMAEKSSMDVAVGKILGKHQSRLFSLNSYGAETAGWYSVLNDPEDFTTGSDIEDASTFVIADGNGGITGFDDFGTFALVEKEDSLHSISIVISEDLVSKLDKIQPIISGDSSGPISHSSVVKINNALYYPTSNNGFKFLYPSSSGDSASVDFRPISQKIHNYATGKVSYDKCIGAGFDNKAIWAVAINGGSENTQVLVYDQLRNAWTRLENLAVKDFGVKDKKLYYLDASSGSVYRLFNKSYNDDNAPYQVEVYFKRFDFGNMALPKTQDLVYVQGYMTPATELYLDVLFNEAGLLEKQTFLINKDTENLYMSEPLTNAAGQLIAGAIPMGWVLLSEIGNLSFFRCALGVRKGNGYFNLQVRARSFKEAFWGITGIAHNPELEEQFPNLFVISPVV